MKTNEFKHAPLGPLHTGGKDDSIIYDADGRPVANAITHYRGAEVETMKRYATLFAAAPELLALAEDFASYLDLKLIGFRQDYPEDHCMVQTAVRYQQAARSAISKATQPTK